MDYLRGSPVNEQDMDKKKAAFKQPSERTKNTPKKEGLAYPFFKPSPEAVTVPLPPEPEEDAGLSGNTSETGSDCEQDLEKEFGGEEDKVRQEEGTDPPYSYSAVPLCA